jgi:hypothetical protein
LAKRDVKRLKRAQGTINLWGRLRRRILRDSGRLGHRRRTIVRARFAQAHLTDNSIELLYAGLQIILKQLKVNLEAPLLATAESTARKIVEVAKTRGQIIVCKCLNMARLQNRTNGGDRRWSRIRRNYTAAGHRR